MQDVVGMMMHEIQLFAVFTESVQQAILAGDVDFSVIARMEKLVTLKQGNVLVDVTEATGGLAVF